MKILILCTANSCRSQMAAAFLKSFAPELEVFSAGTNPAAQVHPLAIAVMKEAMIDLSGIKPQNVANYLDQHFDFVIAVCGDAAENCPIFSGKVKERLHIGFDDPAKATGSAADILQEFRRVRDEIKNEFFLFYKNQIRLKKE
ncbi:MAG: arsenate reductase ArsC [Bacteroidales bacterium]|jgi:arsenate reductase|nr:arsenate reductase ArsC [Bacteroidales bacterium]